MKRTWKLIGSLFISVCVLLVILSGCGGKSVEDFTSKTAGVWQRNGNLQDERLEVLDDGTWTSQKLEDGVWTTTAQGTIAYNKDYKTFEFWDDMSNKIYPVEFFDGNGEVLNFRDNFYRAENSMDGFASFDGNWYQNADMDSDYYSFENGEWKWFKAEGMGHVSVDNGNLAWDGAAEKLLAYTYSDGEVFSAFVISDTGELMLDDVPYVFMDTPASNEFSSDEDVIVTGNGSGENGENTDSEFSIMMGEIYYLNGERGQPSFCFYDNGQVDYDDGYGGDTIEAVYSINDDEIVIKTLDGTMLATLGIVDNSVLIDDGGEDIYAISTD